jgi:hypothetical protein
MTNLLAIRQAYLGKIIFRPSNMKLAACLTYMKSIAQDHEDDFGLALLLAEASHLSDYGRPVTGSVYRLIDDSFVPDNLTQANKVDPYRNFIVPKDVPDDELSGLFPDLSLSDIRYVRTALASCTSDRNEMVARAKSWLHNGQADYALMVEEDDAKLLEAKLSDLAAWGQHFALGR